jgi:hypothetical protein
MPTVPWFVLAPDLDAYRGLMPQPAFVPDAEALHCEMVLNWQLPG